MAYHIPGTWYHGAKNMVPVLDGDSFVTSLPGTAVVCVRPGVLAYERRGDDDVRRVIYTFSCCGSPLLLLGVAAAASRRC